MSSKIYLITTLTCLIAVHVNGQNKAVFKEIKPGYFQNSVLRDDRDMKEKNVLAPSKYFAVDLSGVSLPNKMDLYKNHQWHNPSVSQGVTGTCWCFSTTSFLESEIYRIHHTQVKLSEMYTVYWEYVEKARRFVQERGNSVFDQGSESNAVLRMWNKYGIVPEDDYTGLLNGRKFHNHTLMMNEMKTYLESLKTTASWNEETALATIQFILNRYLGVPPTEITVNGRKMTPVQYLKEVIKINPDDYVDILSYVQEPFLQKVKYKVPDNWWHNSDYYNVPLNEFMSTLKSVVRKGYTVSINGDISEPGFDTIMQCAVIPDFDIPSAYINDYARQFRFSNRTTNDDHNMHLVGYLEKDGKDWYLIKDSWSFGRNNNPDAKEFGYLFFSEDYIKLKMMEFMVHKDAVKDLLEKMK
jgi:bleomycin hydrolase